MRTQIRFLTFLCGVQGDVTTEKIKLKMSAQKWLHLLFTLTSSIIRNVRAVMMRMQKSGLGFACSEMHFGIDLHCWASPSNQRWYSGSIWMSHRNANAVFPPIEPVQCAAKVKRWTLNDGGGNNFATHCCCRCCAEVRNEQNKLCHAKITEHRTNMRNWYSHLS